MKSFTGNFRRLTLGNLLALLAVFAVIISFVLLMFAFQVIRDRAVHELARDDAMQTSRLVFQSLYSAMRKGWNKAEINDSILRLNSTFPDMKIRVYRGEIVSRQFGEMSGEAGIVQRDLDLRQALQGGEEKMTYPGNDAIRYLYPVIAKDECLKCHTQSHAGAVHGVIDIIYPITALKVSLDEVIASVAAYTLFVTALIFIGLYFKFRNLFALPILSIIRVAKSVARDQDPSRDVGYKGIAENFNPCLSGCHRHPLAVVC